MTDNNEYDALGELFRRKLEDHRIEVDGNGWNEIERSLANRNRKAATIWLWRIGTMAAAASVAALLIFNRPARHTIDETVIVAEEQTNREVKDSMINFVEDLAVHEVKKADVKEVSKTINFKIQIAENSTTEIF